MSEAPPILTPELDARVERLLTDWLASSATTGTAQDFARMARELGVGIVDIGRNRAWVDERVHEGALLRMHKAETALAEFQGLMGGERR